MLLTCRNQPWRIDSKYRNHFILNSNAVLDGNFSHIVTLIFHNNKQKIEVENLPLLVLSFTLTDLKALTQIGGEAFIVFALFNLDAVTEAPRVYFVVFALLVLHLFQAIGQI